MNLDELLKEIGAKEDVKKKASKVIDALKNRRNLPSFDEAIKAINVEKHDVNDPLKRRNKIIKTDTGTRVDHINRVALALQKLIIKRAASFVFGIPVIYNSELEGQDGMEEAIMKAFNRVVKDNKLKSFDRKLARTLFAFQDVAEYWYVVDRKHNTYGFQSDIKLKVALFSPENGDESYPLFNEFGDMIAYSRLYKKEVTGLRTDTYFETFTDNWFYRWVVNGTNSDDVEFQEKEHGLGKIPIIFSHQVQRETEDVDSIIDRLEKLLSNFAETNDRHASPKIVATGEIAGFAEKGESGQILQLQEGANVKYLEWSSAPDSVKTEIETLLKMIYTISQTPDISFESMKGLGQISGVALELMFMDAHLKALDKSELLDSHLQRRANIIKAFLGVANPKFAKVIDDIFIEPEITPFVVNDTKSDIERWITANGGKPLISHEESVKQAGLSQNTSEDFRKIEEQEASLWNSIQGEPIDSLAKEEDFE